MASAGAQCNHVNHVTTQLPYAVTVAVVSCVTYLVAGVLQNFIAGALVAVISLVVGIVLMIGTLLVMRSMTANGHLEKTN